MTRDEAIGALGAIRIFSGCAREDLAAVAGEMTARMAVEGETIVREGDEGREFFLIARGSVSVTVACPDGSELEVSRLGPGDFFGEMSIVENAPRSATCRAAEECELLTLARDDFDRMVKAMPNVSVKVLRGMLDAQLARLSSLGSLVSEMAQWGDEARARAVTDPATGLFNRRYYEESLEDLAARAKVDGRPLSLAMFDLDRFGEINRVHGIAFGDELVVILASLFREVFSPDDILVRYGGDEFVFIFPGASFEEAGAKCDALCAAVRAFDVPGKPELRLTCSLGYSTFPDRASDVAALAAVADKALYAAKESGRDRAVGA